MIAQRHITEINRTRQFICWFIQIFHFFLCNFFYSSFVVSVSLFVGCACGVRTVCRINLPLVIVSPIDMVMSVSEKESELERRGGRGWAERLQFINNKGVNVHTIEKFNWINLLPVCLTRNLFFAAFLFSCRKTKIFKHESTIVINRKLLDSSATHGVPSCVCIRIVFGLKIEYEMIPGEAHSKSTTSTSPVCISLISAS